MSDRIDFSSFRDNAPIITISLSGRDANICVFFSMNCCTKMFEHHEQGDDFRTAFAKAVFLMFQNTECNDGEGLTETDFLSAPDDSLLLVLNAILEQDNKLKNEYDKATGSSAYEQFFTANESILKNASAGLSKSFERISGIFESQNKLLSTSLGNALSNLTIPHDYLPGLTSAISNIFSIARPIGVEVSNFSVEDTNSTLYCWNNSIMLAKSRMERLIRSSL